MKDILPDLFFSVLILGNLKCEKRDLNACTQKTPQSEQADILAFAVANSMTVTAHSSGI
jgi:hypothetical protein